MTPEAELFAESFRLAQDALSRALIVPESGLADARVELRQAALLGGEVKDAPMSPGSVRRDPGFRPAPLGAAPGILQEDRPKLDETQSALASGDNGVHAGAVDVVSTHSAVTVAVQGGGIAAVPAIPFTGDEIHELGFLGLLHKLPHSCPSLVGRADGWDGAPRRARATCNGLRHRSREGEGLDPSIGRGCAQSKGLDRVSRPKCARNPAFGRDAARCA